MSAVKQSTTLSQKFMAWVRSPTGLFSTHTWGPLANWGFVVAVSSSMIEPRVPILLLAVKFITIHFFNTFAGSCGYEKAARDDFWKYDSR